MLDDGWSYMDTFATLSFDLILSIYICMLCGNICNKLSNVAANFFFFLKTGVKSQCGGKSRGIFARAKLSLPSQFNTVTRCSKSRGKVKLRFHKARVKSQW
jgi:hypothetical protein